MTIHKIKPVIITALSMLMLSAVSSCKHNKQLNQVHYLQSRTDSIAQVFQSVSMKQLAALEDSTSALIERFWACCGDSLEGNARLSLRFSALQKVKKGLGKVIADLQKIRMRIGYSRKKLDDLAHDVKNGLMDDKAYAKAYQDEKAEQDFILKETLRVKKASEELRGTYEKMSPSIRETMKKE
jgi:hypothetical protein